MLPGLDELILTRMLRNRNYDYPFLKLGSDNYNTYEVLNGALAHSLCATCHSYRYNYDYLQGVTAGYWQSQAVLHTHS